MVTVLGRAGRGSSQVEKSPFLNWATQFLTVVYDGACPPNASFRMAWIFSAPCLAGKKKKKTWLQLASRCCWNCARRLTCLLSASVRRKDLQFGTWTDPSFQRHYRFPPTTSEVVWAKYLSAPPRNVRHPVTKSFNTLYYTSPNYTSLHYTCRNFTSSLLNFTQLHFTTLSFALTPFKFPAAPFHLTSLHFTSLHFTSLHCIFRWFSPHFCSFYFTLFTVYFLTLFINS